MARQPKRVSSPTASSWKQGGKRRPASIQKQARFGVLHHPRQAVGKIRPGDCTATDDVPLMRSYRLQLEELPDLLFIHAAIHVGLVGKDE